MTHPQETPESVIIIDDDRHFASLVQRWVEISGFKTEVFNDAESFLSNLDRLVPACVCLDLTLPDADGLFVLQKLKSHQKHLPVIILTANSAADLAVKAMQLGAYDYLVKPIDRTKLLATVKNSVERYQMSVKLAQFERESSKTNSFGIIGNSEPMKNLYRQIEKIAACDISVLICGESGTGKELIAKAIHQNSGRSGNSLVTLNCAAIPESLQESELFGHEKGSFTGATNRRQGKFELADKGTLFLDEVAELSLGLQAKLLRVLQDKTFSVVGSASETKSDFRLIAASHKDLTKEVEAGRFREDLFFRLAIYELEVVPLRERKDDIPVLVQHFLKDFGKRDKRRYKISADAMLILQSYDFRGNVRELENCIERALVSLTENTITPDDFPTRIRDAKRSETMPELISAELPETLAKPDQIIQFTNATFPVMTLENLEKLAIQFSINRNAGNISNAAEELQIARATLYRKIKQYELNIDVNS
jgi:two-component system, NtrC family, response regulator AtoC